MLTRNDRLQEYFRNLQAFNQQAGGYDQEIQNVLEEISNELGIGDRVKTLNSYTTEELHRELANREAVYETRVDMEEEAIITVTKGEHDDVKSFSGPVSILVNRD